MIKKILTITGASGAGKSTLEKSLLKHYGGGRVRSITTRQPRTSETDADYDFQTKESLDGRTDLLWIARIHGNLYTVSRAEFYKAAKETGGLAIICVTPVQHELVAELFVAEDVRFIPVHLMPPSEQELIRRLKARGEDDEAIAKRLADSFEFERIAAQLAHLHRIMPASPDEVFQQVVNLIEATP